MKRSSSKRFGIALVSLVLSLALAEAAAGYLFPYFQPWTVAPDLDTVIIAPLVENIVRTQMAERDGRQKPYFTLVDGQLQARNYPLTFRALPPESAWRRAEDRERRQWGLYDSALWQLTLAAMRPVSLSLGLYNPYAAYYNGPAGELLERILVAFREEAKEAHLIFAPLPTYHYIEYDLAPDYEPVFRRAA